MAFAKELEGWRTVVDLEQVQAEEDKILGKFITDLNIRFLIKSVVFVK